MFTGLVADLGDVAALDATADGVRLRVRTALAGELSDGDSIAVNGVCLTAVEPDDASFGADVMHETLRRSSLHAGAAAPLVASRGGARDAREPRAAAARRRASRRSRRPGPRRRRGDGARRA